MNILYVFIKVSWQGRSPNSEIPTIDKRLSIISSRFSSGIPRSLEYIRKVSFPVSCPSKASNYIVSYNKMINMGHIIWPFVRYFVIYCEGEIFSIFQNFKLKNFLRAFKQVLFSRNIKVIIIIGLFCNKIRNKLRIPPVGSIRTLSAQKISQFEHRQIWCSRIRMLYHFLQSKF